MEREKVRVFVGKEADLMSAVRLVILELKRTDLEPLHRQYTEEIHASLVQECIDKGLTKYLCEIRDNIDMEQRLCELKKAWNDGEIAR